MLGGSNATANAIPEAALIIILLPMPLQSCGITTSWAWIQL
jgi:hypothetical protein